MRRAFRDTVGQIDRSRGDQRADLLLPLFLLSRESRDLPAQFLDLHLPRGPFVARKLNLRRTERRERIGADHEIIRIQRGLHSADVPVAVDERVIDVPIPSRRNLPREIRAPGNRRDEARVTPLLQIQRELHLIPFAHFQGLDRVSRIGVAAEEFAAIEKQLHRRGIARTVPEVKPPGPRAARIHAGAAEIETRRKRALRSPLSKASAVSVRSRCSRRVFGMWMPRFPIGY